MRILFSAGSFERGGKEQRMRALMEALATRGFELGIIASRESPHLSGIRDICSRIYEYRAGERAFNLRQHQIAVKEFAPDVIHSWNRSCTSYAILAQLRRRCPIITSEVTNARRLNLGSFEYWMSRANFAGSSIVCSNTRAGLKAKRVPANKGHVIYNGYDLARHDRIDTEKYACMNRPGRLNIIMAARFCRAKDHATVLEAARLAKEAGLNAQFVLAGDGEGLTSVCETARGFGLENVTFPGHVPDMDNLLCHMHVGVLASDPRFHEEGLSNSVLECMAHGLPVVVTDGPAIPELVRDGVDGFVVPPRDPGELFRKLTMLLADVDLRNKLGDNAADAVRRRFDLGAMADRFIKLYRRVLVGAQPLTCVPLES